MVGDNPHQGRLVVLLGPSAVGKSTVVHRLREELPTMYFSVSMTTRAPRPGEVDGVHYFFVTPEEFQRRIDAGEMLEWADIHGGLQRSGTPAGPVDQALSAGRPVLVEVDLVGARAIERLTGRGTESDATIQRRLETARVELAAQNEFRHVIVNDDVERAVAQLRNILLGVK